MINQEDIKDLRQSMGMTQEQFAEHLGTTLETVSRWENGHTKPLRIYRLKLQELMKKQHKESTCH